METKEKSKLIIPEIKPIEGREKSEISLPLYGKYEGAEYVFALFTQHKSIRVYEDSSIVINDFESITSGVSDYLISGGKYEVITQEEFSIALNKAIQKAIKLYTQESNRLYEDKIINP